jgi:PAS domain S-box-containing protein
MAGDPNLIINIALVVAVALLSFGGGATFLKLRLQKRSAETKSTILESRLVAAIESQAAGFALFDKDGLLVFSNTRLREMLPRMVDIAPGLPAAMVLGAIAEHLTPFGMITDRKSLMRDLHAVFDDLSGKPYEERTRTGRWLRLRASQTGDGDRLLLLNDVTAEVLRETAMRDSEARFRDLVELSSDWIWETGPDGRLTFVSENFARTLGVASEALLGKRREALSDVRSNPAAWRSHLSAIVARQPFRDFEHSMIASSGEIRRVRDSGRPYFASDGAFLGYRGTGRDVTREWHAEARAERSHRILEEAVEAMSEGFALFDRDDRLVMCNTKFIQQHPKIASLLTPGVGYPQILRAIAESGVVPGVDGRIDEWVSERVERNRSARAVSERRMPNGGWVGVTNYHTEDGSRVILYTDITEIKEHEVALSQRVTELQESQSILKKQRQELAELAETLEAARDQAERANRAKSAFLATMSHELRTPLNAIIGFAEIIRDHALKVDDDPRYSEYATDVFDSGRHLLDLINDILDVSRLDSGRLELNCNPFSVAAAVRNVAEAMRGDITAAGLDLEVDIPEGLPDFDADERRIKQIAMKLLSNAIKFTRRGGTITVRVARNSGSGLTVSVSDTGIGMAPEDIPRAVESFQQIDSDLNRKYPGSGLGLPLSKAMIELHGGTLSIESVVGQGTTVRFSLPFERSMPSTESGEPASGAG